MGVDTTTSQRLQLQLCSGGWVKGMECNPCGLCDMRANAVQYASSPPHLLVSGNGIGSLRSLHLHKSFAAWHPLKRPPVYSFAGFVLLCALDSEAVLGPSRTALSGRPSAACGA